MNTQLVIILLLCRSLLGISESTITHASNVSKRQLQYGGNFPPPSYQTHGNQQTNNFVQTPALLYDPGYNAQHLHEVGTATDNTTDAAELRTPPNATLAQTNADLDTQFGTPQTFSHIYFPHAFAAGAQHTLSRTAAHAFPVETPAVLAARNSGRTYSTSSTYFVPLSVLYHPNADAQQPHSVYTQHLAQQRQQQQMQAYQPLPPPLPTPALYQQYAPQVALPATQPTATPSIAAQSTQLAQQQQQPTQTSVQPQTAFAQTAYTPPALPPLPRLPHLLPPPSPHAQSSPLPLNFQAPFHPSQFLGYMHERDSRNAVPSTTVSVIARTRQQTQAYPAYPQQQQEQVEKPIYEHMTGGAKQQNDQAAAPQQARYGRYIYMAPHNGYALFKAA